MQRGRLQHLPYWQRNLYVVWTAVFTAQIAFSIVTPFLPAFVSQLGVSQNLAFWSGLVFSINFLTAALIAPVWGSLSDRYGKKPMMLRAGLGMGLTYLAMATSRSVSQLVFWRGLNGLVSGFIPAANTFIASNTPEPELGRSLGLLQAGNAAGLILGPLIGGLIAAYVGPRGSLVVSGVLLILAALAPVVARLEERSPVRQGKPHVLQDVRESLRNDNLRLLFAVQLLVTAGLLIVEPTLPIYIAQITTSHVELLTGLIYSLVGIATIIGSPLLSRRASRHAPALLTAGLAVSALCNIGQGLAPNAGAIAIWRFVFGLANAGVAVSASLMMALSVPADQRGRAFGLLQSINAFGAVTGPLIGGIVGDWLGLRAPFFATALVLAAGAFLVRSARSRLQALTTASPASPTTVSRPVVSASPAASAIDTTTATDTTCDATHTACDAADTTCAAAKTTCAATKTRLPAPSVPSVAGACARMPATNASEKLFHQAR